MLGYGLSLQLNSAQKRGDALGPRLGLSGVALSLSSHICDPAEFATNPI